MSAHQPAGPFDFGALVKRAQADNPDALLLDRIEQHRETNRRLRRTRRGGNTMETLRSQYVAVCREHCQQQDSIAKIAPTTAAGLAAKLQLAIDTGHDAPVFRLQFAALRDALAWFDPPKLKRKRAGKGRARRNG